MQPAAVLLFTSVLSFLDPRRTRLWWLVLGLSIPATHGIVRALRVPLPYEVNAFAGTFVVLLPAGAGALLGLEGSVRARVPRAPRGLFLRL